MNTLGWVFILAAIIMGRAVYKGRVLNLGEDLSDSFLALVSGDTQKLQEVLSRTGDSNTATLANLDIYQNAVNAFIKPGIDVGKGVGSMVDQLEGKANASVAWAAAIVLGPKAKGYRWGASGPDYYDCSGLMWAAMKLTKVYTGSRFSTSNFESATKKVYKRVTGTPQIDDIVLWPIKVPYITGHMGVVVGNDSFYSARSISSGIGESKISTFRHYPPIIFRRYGYPSPDSGK